MWLALFDIAGVIHQLPDTDKQKAIYDRLPAQVRGGGSLENLIHTYNPSYVRHWFCRNTQHSGPSRSRIIRS